MWGMITSTDQIGRSFFIFERGKMIFQGSELVCAICEKTFPRKEMIFSVQNNVAVCENCLRNWRLNGGMCVICFESVNRNQVWGFFKQIKYSMGMKFKVTMSASGSFLSIRKEPTREGNPSAKETAFSGFRGRRINRGCSIQSVRNF